jgi:hypothetical protein
MIEDRDVETPIDMTTTTSVLENDSFGDGYAYSGASDCFDEDSWGENESQWRPTEPDACCLATPMTIVPPPPRNSGSAHDSHLVSSEVSKYVEIALKHDSLRGAPSSILDTVILELRSRILELTRIRHFRECDRYRVAIEYVSSCQQAQAKAEAQREAIETRKLQMCELVRVKSTRNREGRQMLKELEADQAEQRKQLVEAHDRQRAEHEARWRSPRKARLYNRPSFDVLQLRNKETLLVTQGRFVEAEEVAKIARSEIERQEAEKARMRQIDYDESLTKLEAKLDTERQWFDQKAAIERERMRQKWAKEKDVLENKKKQLQTKVDGLANTEMSGHGNQPRLFERIMHLPSTNGKVEAELLALPPLKFQPHTARRTRNLSTTRRESKSPV